MKWLVFGVGAIGRFLTDLIRAREKLNSRNFSTSVGSHSLGSVFPGGR
ncbi:MAG: hypothetical protein NC819_04400 [Candidatus Omnitrophica bacterium]|nr:hypothetical protein [Candidatus Omnitrophota bacterium]